MTKRLTTEEFIDKARLVHGTRYDYSKVVYKKNNSKVTIVCPEHGDFEQLPNSHLSGNGCSKCAIKAQSISYASSLQNFISKAQVVHDGCYDYSQVNYLNAHSKVTIGCQKHGEFQQSPTSHLSGTGCPVCAGVSSLTTSAIIEKYKELHGDFYDYSLVNYVNALTKVTIVCPDHGEFEQTPGHHLRGYGCSRCTHRVSKPSQAWLDHLGIPDTPKHREVKSLITGSRYTVDGFDPDTKTVYEFLGDFWHGNPSRYDQTTLNSVCKKPFGQLYEKTLEKRRAFLDAGYQYVEIWESEWNQIVLDESF